MLQNGHAFIVLFRGDGQMGKAVIVGGTGQIGRAVAQCLMNASWEVTIVGRKPQPAPDRIKHIACAAHDTDKLARVIGTTTDLVLSCVAFDAIDAKCLTDAGRQAGRLIAISSASVYCDSEGRTLDEAAKCGFPEFQMPLTEQSPTVRPGPETYSTRKVAMEHALLANASCPATLLRPCAIHGPNSKHAREWWFVRRLLEGRTAIPLAYRGGSRFQTTSVNAIAEAVMQACEGKLPEIVNVSDADSPSVASIGQTIMRELGVKADLVGLPAELAYPPIHGATPWSVPHPMVCSSIATSRATYAQSIAPSISWLVDVVAKEDWIELLPQLAGYQRDHFDYSADDMALRLPGAMLLAA